MSISCLFYCFKGNISSSRGVADKRRLRNEVKTLKKELLQREEVDRLHSVCFSESWFVYVVRKYSRQY